MSLLRQGITGFDVQSTVDFRAFKKAVFAAAQATDATVISIVASKCVTPNFHQAELLYARREFGIICNRNFPVVAFVTTPIAMGAIQPFDFPELAAAISEFGFEVPSASELQRMVESDELEILSKGERHEVKYWKPKRIADVVFNWWD